jgi:hypothetical protein
VLCDKTPLRCSALSNKLSIELSRALSSSLHSSSTPRQSGFPKNVLVLFFNFPRATGSSTAATTASK